MAKDIDSKIYLKEMVENTERKFGSWNEYYPTYVEDEEGQLHAAMFTKDQIEVAMERAAKNVEDMPEEDGGGLFGWLF